MPEQGVDALHRGVGSTYVCTPIFKMSSNEAESDISVRGPQYRSLMLNECFLWKRAASQKLPQKVCLAMKQQTATSSTNTYTYQAIAFKVVG